MDDEKFELAGAELSWPITVAAGMTNHPDINAVAARFGTFTSLGLPVVPLGSWKLGEPNGGNGYLWNGEAWEYQGGDEHFDLATRAGYNAKGLPGPGTDIGMEHFADFVDMGRSRGVEVGLSLSPHTANPLEEVPELVEVGRKALKLGALYIEFNLSCPNIPDRPPFYKDKQSVHKFFDMVEGVDPLQNRFGFPTLYPKYGPTESNETIVYRRGRSVGSKIRSNTLANQEPKHEDGTPAITVNNGKAGMSGPALEVLGRQQLGSESPEDGELISSLGASRGIEVKRRLQLGANVVQLASVLYWPELIGCETSAEAAEQIKREFVEAMVA